MIFRRTIFSALLVGLIAGLILSLAQIFAINPIIFDAESYEVVSAHSHEHGEGEGAEEEAWAPEDGSERTTFTIISNIGAGIGFAAILLALMSQLQSLGVARLNLAKGALWGIAGFTAFFIAPGIGLPPEIPGIEAEPVAYRQQWWLLAVAGVGLGLLVIAFAPLKFKLLGLVLVALPYVVEIPHHTGPAFTHPDPDVVAALTQLHQDFIITSGVSNFVFWVAMGIVSALLVTRWVLANEPDAVGEH